MAVIVHKVSSKEDLQITFDIRVEVFVKEQKVPMEEEIDQFEDDSFHFLAKYNGEYCGAARWRFTENGIKLERFAVLQSYRGKSVGSALVKAVIDDIKSHEGYRSQMLYLNAQIDAMPLYAKFGFEPEGKMFLECDIEHMKMVIKH